MSDPLQARTRSRPGLSSRCRDLASRLSDSTRIRVTRGLAVLDGLVGHPFRGAALVALWPFVFFAPHLVPVAGTFLRLGNDFDSLYYAYKVYLLDGLSQGHMPLWSPSEGAGFPFLANPFAQALYPLNLPLVLAYRAFGGYSVLDHHVFTVLGVAIFASGLLCWLRRFPLSPRAVVFSACLLPISFKMAEILRFPNAVHTAAWYPWLLYGVTRVLLARREERLWRPALGLAFSVTCLLTGGYPYYVYYAVFLLVPYGLLLTVPRLRAAFWPGAGPVSRRSLAVAGLSVAGPALLCSPYLVLMSRLLQQTTHRAGRDYAYATAHVFDLQDTLGSLVYPPAAQAEGWYYFGIIGLLVIVLYLLVPPAVAGREQPSGDGGGGGWCLQPPDHRLVRWLLLGWVGVVSYITYGRKSLLFGLLWETMPGFSNLRVWGRMNIILLPILALFVACGLSSLEAHLTARRPDQVVPRRILLVAVLGYAVILVTQIGLVHWRFLDPYWQLYFGRIPGQELVVVLVGLLAFGALARVLAAAARRPLGTHAWTGVLAAWLLLSAVDVGHIGLTMWSSLAGYREASARHRLRLLDRVMPQSLTTPRLDHHATISLTNAHSVGTVPDWYFQRYVSFRERFPAGTPGLRALLGGVDGRRLFLTRSADHVTPGSFLSDAAGCAQRIRALAYTGDSLDAEVETAEAGFLCFIDNWDPAWTASVDGRPAALERPFGTFKAVRVPAGRSRVTFRYRPFRALLWAGRGSTATTGAGGASDEHPAAPGSIVPLATPAPPGLW